LYEYKRNVKISINLQQFVDLVNIFNNIIVHYRGDSIDTVSLPSPVTSVDGMNVESL
jgi:hypothetical protein